MTWIRVNTDQYLNLSATPQIQVRPVSGGYQLGAGSGTSWIPFGAVYPVKADALSAADRLTNAVDPSTLTD